VYLEDTLIFMNIIHKKLGKNLSYYGEKEKWVKDIAKMWYWTQISPCPRPLFFFGNTLKLGFTLHLKHLERFLDECSLNISPRGSMDFMPTLKSGNNLMSIVGTRTPPFFTLQCPYV
jgi:hypothetical protein